MTIEAGLKHSALTEKSIGAFYDVYNELGYGFLESGYQQAYLRATEIEIGMPLNFGEQPHLRRLLLDNESKKIPVTPRKYVAGVGL